MPVKQTVHALSEGLPLCLFSQDIPAKWPENHSWTTLDDLEHITCTDCKDKAKQKKNEA